MNLHRVTLPNLVAFLLVTSVAASTLAQAATKDPAATQHMTKAMDSLYRQGAFEETEAHLLGILKACKEQCSAPVKARIWMYIGVVRMDGRHKPGQAKQAFEDAVKLEPTVQLDRTIASLEAASLFAKASANTRDTTAPQPAAGGTAPAPVTQPAPAAPLSPANYGQVQPIPNTVQAQPASVPPAQSTCYPACRSGYVCNQGACVSTCNPPCNPGQTCTPNGQCLQYSMSSQPVAPNNTPPRASAITAKPSAPGVQPSLGQPAGTVPVRFVAKNRDLKYTVLSPDGKQRCDTPCTLYLPPGHQATITVTGAASFSDKVEVSPYGSTLSVYRKSVGLARAGMIVVTAGTVGLSTETIIAQGNVGIGDILVWLGVDVVGLVLWLSSGGNGFDALQDARGQTDTRLRLNTVGISPNGRGGGQLTTSFSF